MSVKDALDDPIIGIVAVLATTFIIVVGAFAIDAAFFSDSGDDRPSWANDMAGRLDKSGGRVWVYNEGASGYSARIDYIVSVSDEVYADNYGIVVRQSGGVMVFPYDKIWGIYPAGGSA